MGVFASNSGPHVSQANALVMILCFSPRMLFLRAWNRVAWFVRRQAHEIKWLQLKGNNLKKSMKENCTKAKPNHVITLYVLLSMYAGCFRWYVIVAIFCLSFPLCSSAFPNTSLDTLPNAALKRRTCSECHPDSSHTSTSVGSYSAFTSDSALLRGGHAAAVRLKKH
jgi:hypothetical protein